MYWLGVDIGTGGSRAVLVDRKGLVKSGFTARHEDMRMTKPLWAEQHPENWWEATQKAIRGVMTEAGVQGKYIKGVGLSGQMHGLVLLDENNVVIRPALIWCDQRSQPQVDFINQKVGKSNVVAFTANPVLTGFTLPKLLWVRDNEPDNYRRARRILLPKDYIRFQLTGEYATDVSDASGTALFDVVLRSWSKEMLNRLGIDRQILPEVYESSDVTGRVTGAAAALTGLEAGTPVVGGAGDQAASAVGNGIVEPGVVSCTIGTSGVVFAYMEKPTYDPAGRVHTFCHAVKGSWHVMGVTQGAGLSLQWFRDHIASGSTYDALTSEAATAAVCSHGLFWLPYMMGERTPHLDPTARGGWVGLTAKHTRADLIRALLEGVSYSLKDCLEIIEHMQVPVDRVRVSGGGARSAFWRQLLSDIFGKRVAVPECHEGSAYGAALLALVATGEYSSVPEACRACVREVDSLMPRAHESQRYQRAYEVYRALYPTLRPIYGLIDSLC